MTLALWMILISTFLNATAQVLLKMGLPQIPVEISSLSYLQLGLQWASNPLMVLGVACYGISLIFWLRALSTVDLSYGVPLLSFSYVLTALAGVVFFQETLTLARILGIGLVIGGIILVAKTA